MVIRSVRDLAAPLRFPGSQYGIFKNFKDDNAATHRTEIS
jgi:hypothetical protein